MTEDEKRERADQDDFRMPCEGSGHETHGARHGRSSGMCAMCGRIVWTTDRLAEGHTRLDVLRMIDAGVFR